MLSFFLAITGILRDNGQYASYASRIFNIENLDPGATSHRIEHSAWRIAYKYRELYWSARVYEIPNSKHQITNKSQIPISNDQNRFGILNFGHCYLFVI